MAQVKHRPAPSSDKPRRVGGKRAGQGRWGSGPIQCRVCQHPDRSRIDYLCATGAAQSRVAAQFGLVQQYVNRHFKQHVSPRYKAMVAASYNASYEKLLKDATEANSESVDTLNLMIRGHTQMWACAHEAGDHKMMSIHAQRVFEGVSLRSKITCELASPGTITINNFLLKDAAELVNALRDNQDAVAKIESWYRWRTQGRLIEAEANVKPAD